MPHLPSAEMSSWSNKMLQETSCLLPGWKPQHWRKEVIIRLLPPLPTSSHPRCVAGLVGDQLAGFEPQRDLGGGVLRAVAAMDQVVLNAQGEIATDGGGERLGAVGRAH